MKPEDKELLFKDLCARLPYGVICKFTDTFDGCEVDNVLHPDDITDMFRHRSHCDSRIDIKPYLRPMSSMTEEEKKEYQSLCVIYSDHDADDNVTYYYFDTVESFDWLNKNMFDYRELIPKGLALSTEIFNPYNND